MKIRKVCLWNSVRREIPSRDSLNEGVFRVIILINGTAIVIGALPASGQYSSYIACHLTEGDREKVGQVIMAGPGEAVPELPEEMPHHIRK